jgi:hypothetical protein
MYKEDLSFRTSERKTMLSLSDTPLRVALGHQWIDVAFREVSPVFAILSEEYNFTDIPVCAIVLPDNQYSRWKEQFRSVHTDERGYFSVEFSSSYNIDIVVSANGGEKKSQLCGPDQKLAPRGEIKGSTYYVYSSDFTRYGSDIKYPVDIPLYITLDGELLQLQRQVDDLVSHIAQSPLSEIIKQIDALIGSGTPFAARFPKSSKAIRDSVLSVAERTLLAMADSLYQAGKYEPVLTLYSELTNLLPTSSSSALIASKRARAQAESVKNVHDRAARTYCDSIMAVAMTMKSKSRAVQFLESKRRGQAGTNPYWRIVEERIHSLRDEADVEEEEALIESQRRADDAALKRFNVDPAVTQLDFFRNPFAFKDQYIALGCIIEKFETPASAFMRAANQFYADFKVPPPKKFKGLYLIVRVKGVKQVVNAFGTTIRIPYVEVVHYLNLPPE